MSLDNCQKSIIEQLTNKFEYDQLNFQFDFCKNINDGRGYTAGIVGFTTGTQDAYAVVKEYNELDGHTNEFQNYTTRLSQLASSSRTNGDTNGLQGFCLAWHTASANSVFRQVQINKMNQFYYNTALSKAQSAGLVNPSSIGQFYDAAIQHGVEGDDGLQDMISRTKATPPSQGGDEIQFIKTFMDTRKQILCNPKDTTTRKQWCDSKTRVTSYQYAITNNPVFKDQMSALDNDGNTISIKCDTNIENTYIPGPLYPDTPNTTSSDFPSGAVVGVLIGIIAVCGIAYFWHRNRSQSKQHQRIPI